MARIFPPSFARSPEGDLYCAMGDRAVRRWDGLLSDFVDAGVPAPASAASVASTTGGTICGRIYAYVRFVDSRGNVSNLSPVSTVHNIGISTGSITAATNAGPIAITSTGHGLTTGYTVKIDGVIGNYAANGIWVVTVTDANTFTLDGSVGSGTYSSGGTWRRGAASIDYTSIPTTTDTRVAKKQILRNKDGDTSVFYVDLEITNLATTSQSSTNTDADLTTAVVLMDTDGRDLNVATHAEPPNWKRFIAHFRGRLWMAGQLRYREGGVALTNGSPTVTGLGTNWTSAMAGWEFFPLGTSNTISYTISSINTTTQVITLDANYAGSTEAYLPYALTPPVLNSNGGSEDRTIYFSSAGIPESFDLLRSLTLEETNQGDITGLIPYQNNLYVACERALYRIIFATRPESDATVRGIVRRGLVNHRCWRLMDDLVFGMDRRGCYVYNEGELQDISDPIRGLFDGTATTRINWRHSESFHAVDFPDQSLIKWFVVLSGGFYPRHAICYSLRTKRWWVEEYSIPVTSSTVGILQGKQTVLLGLPSRRVAAAIETSGEGLPGACISTLRGTATSSGIVSLTDSTAAFTSDVVGTNVRIVEGKGKGQQRQIISQTGTKLTVAQPWKIKPDTTSIYQVGGVWWQWRCGSLRWSTSTNQKRQSAEIIWGPTQNTQAMALKRYISLSATPDDFSADSDMNAVRTVDGEPEAWVTTTDTRGFVRQEYSDVQPDQVHGRETVQLQLDGVTNNELLQVYELSTEGASR